MCSVLLFMCSALLFKFSEFLLCCMQSCHGFIFRDNEIFSCLFPLHDLEAIVYVHVCVCILLMYLQLYYFEYIYFIHVFV